MTTIACRGVWFDLLDLQLETSLTCDSAHVMIKVLIEVIDLLLRRAIDLSWRSR